MSAFWRANRLKPYKVMSTGSSKMPLWGDNIMPWELNAESNRGGIDCAPRFQLALSLQGFDSCHILISEDMNPGLSELCKTSQKFLKGTQKFLKGTFRNFRESWRILSIRMLKSLNSVTVRLPGGTDQFLMWELAGS